MPPPTPKVGTVDNGFRFAGGSPADPNNWKRLPPKKGAVEDGFRFVGKDPADPNSWSDVEQEGGFWSTIFDRAQTLGLADEAAAFAANPNEKTRRAFLAAGNSKYRGVEFGEGANWVAFKQALGGSIGDALAPLAAGIGTSFVGTPIAGLAAATATSGAQYTTQNLLRQAQEQERAIQEKRAPEETSVGKALTAAAGQTGLELVGGRVFSGITKLFPFARPLLGDAGGEAAKKASDVMADAFEKGTVSFTKGVAKGTGKGIAFEVPQEIAQTSLERWQAGLSLSDDEALGEYKQAAIGAALLGGGFGAVSGGLGSRRPGTALPPTDIEPAPLSKFSAEELDAIANEVITTPEDRAEFDTLFNNFSVNSGIPEEDAKRFAINAVAERKKAERAQQAREAGVAEEAEAETLDEAAPAVTPIPREEFTPKSVVDMYLAGAGRGDSPFDLELQQYVANNIDAVETEFASRSPAPAPTVEPTVAPIAPEVAPAAEVAPAPTVEPAAAVKPKLSPIEQSAVDLVSAVDAGGVPFNTPRINAIARGLGLEVSKTAKPEDTIQRLRDAVGRFTYTPPISEAAPAVEPAPLRSVYDAPNMTARVEAAKPIVSSIIESIPGMAGVKIPTKFVGTAARQIARLAANQQTFNPVQIVTDALTALGIAPNPVEAAPAPEPVAPSVADVAVPDTAPAVEPAFAEPQFAQAEVVQEPVQETVTEVPVTKVAPGVARGVKPVQRGVQGNKQGRPVEGAAELTEGMQAQQALTTDLEAARDTQEITDAEMREVLDYIRAPESRLQLREKPEEIRPQWRRVLDLSDKVELQQQLVYDLPTRDKARPAAQATLDELKSNLNAAQTDIVNNARAKLDTARASRVSARQKVEEDFKADKITERDRRIQLGELRVSRAEGDVEGEATELAAKVVQVAKQERKLKPVLELLAQQDSKLGELAKRALPIIRDIPVVVVSPDMMRSMARKPGEKLDDTTVIEGLFVPERNTIFLNSELQYDHVALHEALHSVIDGHISRNTPAGSELKSIYSMFKKLASPEQQAVYGFKDAHEFVAEAWSNDSFRNLLRTLTPPETKAEKNLLQRVVDAIKRVFQSALGTKKQSDPVVDYVERVMRIVETAAAEPVQSTKGPSAAQAPKEKMDRGLYKAQMANTATGLTEGIDEAVANVQLSNKEKLRANTEAFQTGARPVFAAIKPTSWIRENITKLRASVGSIVNDIDRLEQAMRGMRTSMRTALSRRVREFETFVNKYGQGAISSMMTIARVNRVDVTAYATRAEALANDPVLKFEKARKNVKGERKREKAINTAWDAWDALGKQAGGHEMYKKVRQFYKDMYIALRAAQDQDIRNLGLDKEATDRLIREARGEVDEDAVTDSEDDNPGVPQKLFPKEYFPFRRFGNYVLVVKEGKRSERERYHFDTAKERNEFQARVANKLGLQRGTEKYDDTFDQLDGLQNLRDDEANNEGFMLKRMFDVIDKQTTAEGEATGTTTAMKESLKNKLYQTYLLTLPERSLQKQLIHAKLVPGHSADALNVFRTSVAQYSAQLPKVVYGGAIQKKIEAAYDTIKGGDPSERAKLRTLLDVYVQRTRGAMDAEAYGALEQFVSSFTFLSLMTSIASAAVQPLTLPMQVMPRMFARYGFSPTLAAVGKYTPLFSLVEASVDVDPVTGERVLVAPTIGNTKFIKTNPLRARLWNELNFKRDLFSQKQTDMLLRDRPTKDTTRDTALKKVGGAYESIVDASGAIFSSADQLTREVSGMSFAELEYNRLIKAGKSHEAAIEGAVEAAVNNTNETIGNYTELEKLDIFRGGPLRRMIGFLRTYSVQRTAYYLRMMGALTKGSPTQTKIQAFNELSMVLVFTSAAAGLSANFGYSFITSVLDTMMPALLGEDEMEEWREKDPLGADDADYRFRFQWLPENFGADSTVTRLMQKGVLSELTGWDWTTRLSQSNLWIREGREGETLREDIVNFFVANLAPQVSQSANIIDGVDDFMRGEWSKGFSKIVPAAVRGAFTAERQAREGDTTKTGKVTRGSEEFTTTELVGQVLGFTPDELSRVREINRTTTKWQRSMTEERGKLFQEFRDVYGDENATQEELEAVFEKMRRFNAKVPLNREGNKISKYLIEGRDLERSLQSAETREEKSYRGIEYNDGEEELFFPYETRAAVQE
jgi:hypothetical protein